MTQLLYGNRRLPTLGALDVIPEAFRQSSDVVNLFQLATAQQPTYDSTFDFSAAAATLDPAFRERNLTSLARAQSQADFDGVVQRVRQQEEDRSRLASAGWGGMAVSMFAGLLSPTVFIPLVGGARGVRGAAQAFGLAAAGATASELPLLLNQETRTVSETFAGIAAGTVLGGLLGTTAVYMRRGDFQRIAAELNPETPSVSTAALVRTADGALVRTGEQMPLQGLDMPVRTAYEVRSTGRPVEVTLYRGVAADTDPTQLQAGGRFMSTDPKVAEIFSRRGTGQVVSESLSFENPLIVNNWAEAKRALGLPQNTDMPTLVQAAAAAGHDGMNFKKTTWGDEWVDLLSPQERQARKDSREATVPATSRQEPVLIEEGAVSAPRAEVSTVGAKQTRALEIPVFERIDPATGKRTFEPIISEAETMTMDNALGVGEIAARINPIARLVQQFGAPVRSLVAARVGLRLSTGGISWRGSDFGLTVAPGGTVEARLGYYRALQGRAYEKLRDAYSEYVLEKTELSFAERIAQRVRVETNMAPVGKLNYQEFSAAVTEALNKGDTHPIRQVAEVAQFVRKEVYAPILRAAEEAADEWGSARLFKEIQFEQNHSYMTHHYSSVKVSGAQPEFIQDISNYIMEVTRSTWERRIAKARRNADADLAGADLLELDKETAQRLYDDNLATLEAMKESADPRVVRIKELRQQARDLVDEKLEEFETALERDPSYSIAQPEAAAGQTRVRLAGKSPKEMRDLARTEVAVQRQTLLDGADEIEAGLPKDVLAGVDEAKRLRQMNRIIARSFGRLEAKQEAALKRIEENEALNIAAFERVVSASQKFFRDLPRLDEAQLAAAVKKLEEAWEAAYKAASRGEARLDKLEEDLLFTGYSGKNALKESMAQTGRQQRASVAFDRLSAAMLKDRDSLVAELRSRLDTSIAYVNKVNSKRSERNALLRQKLEALDPQAAARQAKELRARAEGRFDTLDERMLRAGADSAYTRSGDFSFEEAARNYATDLASRIMGQTGRMAQIDAMAGVRGPFKGRHLNLPYEVKRKYLEEDFEKVLDRYLTTMGSDIELYRAFGDRSGSRALFDVLEDLTRIRLELSTRTMAPSKITEEAGGGKMVPVTDARRAADLKAHDAGVESRIKEIEGTLERIRGLRGIPDNPNSLTYRLGRFMLNWNVSSMMGSATLSSIPDAARVVAAHGLNHTFQKSWAPFVRGFTDEAQASINKALNKELRYLNIGIDSFTQQRARNMLDILEPMGRHTKAERAMEWAAQKTPVIGALGVWTDAMKQLTGAATMARFQRIFEETVAGSASQADMKYLAQHDLDSSLIGRIWAEMEKHGTKYDDLLLPNTADWTDYAALRAYMAAMSKADQQLIVTPGLEKPLWLDATMTGRLLGQFRSFTLASSSKILVASLQARGPAALYAAQSAILSLGLGAVSYYIWAMTNTERSREEMRNATWETWTDQAIARSGLLGVFGEAQNILQEIPATRGYVRLSDQELAGRRATSVLGAVAGPSYSKASQVVGFVQGLDDPTEGTVRQARRLLPWQNVFYLREAFTQIEQLTSSTFGLPENRR